VIDKVEGLKLLKKATAYIEHCDYTHCDTCQYSMQCKNMIDWALQFTVITNEKRIEIWLP
jgi:hypothetical protein